MKLGELGEQVVLVSKKAFEKIRFISNSLADVQIYYARKKERDRQVRKKYREKKYGKFKGSGVNIRIIQSYEQGMRDINKAQFSTIVRLAEVLECNPVELLEIT